LVCPLLQEFECGRPWLRSTLSYLNDTPQAEAGIAAMAAAYAAASSFTAVLVWSKAQGMHYPALCTSHEPFTWARAAAVALAWLALAVVFALPSCMYALSRSIPGGQNNLGLSANALDAFRYSVGPLVSLVNSVLVPCSARRLTRDDPNKATALILVSRFMTSVLVPVRCHC